MSFMAAGDEEDDDLDFYDYGGSVKETEPKKQTFPEPTLFSLVTPSDGTSVGRNVAGNVSSGAVAGSAWGRGRPRSKGRGWSRNRSGNVQGLSRQEEMKVLVCSGDVEAVREKLEKGFNPNTPLVGDWTALMYACSNGQSAVAKLLLEKEANVNYQKDMFTVLMALCSSKSSDESELSSCCRELLNHGARVNTHDRYHMTPLLYACESCHRELAVMLISANADVNKQDSRGWTPLCYAASSGDMQLVKALLQSGANPELSTRLGDTPALLAYNNSHNAVGKALDAVIKSQDNVMGVIDHTLSFNSRPNGFAADTEGLASVDSSSRSVVPPLTSTKAGSFQYGDLELFLMGLELGHLIPLFNSHVIKFSDLLSMTEEDLEKMGVSQVGVRRTLLNAITDIHKTRWRMPYSSPYKNRVLSSQEFILALTQLAKHIAYVKGTASFLLKQTQATPSPVAIEKESQDRAKLSSEIAEVIAASQALYNQAQLLEVKVYKGMGTRPPTPGRTLFWTKTRVLWSALFLGTVSFALLSLYHRSSLLACLVYLKIFRH